MAVGYVYQVIDVGQISEQRINIGVICYVVAEVCHRRRKNGRQPDGIDAQFY
jgi:hypothetical protein